MLLNSDKIRENLLLGIGHSPLIIREEDIYSYSEAILGIPSIEDIQSSPEGDIFIYKKDEGKIEFTKSVVMRFLSEIAEIPYNRFALYILIGFDEAGIPAQNSMLKILEEPPSYALIILVVQNPERLLETVRSRCIIGSYFDITDGILDGDIIKRITEYISGNHIPFLEYLYVSKIENSDAIKLLRTYIEQGKGIISPAKVALAEQGIIDLQQTNESPRNIIDRVFL